MKPLLLSIMTWVFLISDAGAEPMKDVPLVIGDMNGQLELMVIGNNISEPNRDLTPPIYFRDGRFYGGQKEFDAFDRCALILTNGIQKRHPESFTVANGNRTLRQGVKLGVVSASSISLTKGKVILSFYAKILNDGSTKGYYYDTTLECEIDSDQNANDEENPFLMSQTEMDRLNDVMSDVLKMSYSDKKDLSY